MVLYGGVAKGVVMGPFRQFAVAVTSIGVLIGCMFRPKVLANDAAAAGIAVVELFTSEGCSSCPPADAALGEVIRDANGKRVFALAFHVDYWNRLGWRDPYSKAAFSDRQKAYKQTLGLNSVYTPQVVINGRVEFVGSNLAKLRTEVAAALAAAPQGALSTTISRTDSRLTVLVTPQNIPAGTLIHVAVVQREVSTDVPRGENGGRTLKHFNVVRGFASETLTSSDALTVTVDAPSEGWPTDASVIAYAQRPAGAVIVAATEQRLPR